MGTETLAISSGRMFRYAFGSLLLLAGTALLVAHGLAWLDLEPQFYAPCRAAPFARSALRSVRSRCW